MFQKLKQNYGKKSRVAAIIAVLAIFLLPNFVFAEKIGWVTDIHAGSTKKKKKSSTNIFYPRYYKQYLSQALIEMKNEGVEVVIVSGDVTDKGKQTKYAKRVRSLIKEKGMEMIWARGNHDREKTVKKYMKQRKSYYYLDRYDWRIIVVDNSQRLSAREGGMKSFQQEWLEDLLEETDKPVLAVMHYPFQNMSDGSIYNIYRDAEEWFSSDEKVKLALSGHWHTEYTKIYHGVKYVVGNPLTIESKMGSYYIVDLETLEIDARQAQVSQELKKKTRSGRI